MPEHVLDPKMVAIWSSAELELLEHPSGWVKKCQSCSDADPYNNWHLWSNHEWIAAHCMLEQQGHQYPPHSGPEAIEENPPIWVGVPTQTQNIN